MKGVYIEHFRIAWKRMLGYVERNCNEYNNSVKRNYVVRLYCERVGLIIPLKKQRVKFIVGELVRNGSPIFWEGELNKPKTKIKTKRVTKLQKKKAKEQRKVDYKKYLKSTEWKTFKNGVIKMRGNKCEKCGKMNVVLDGHHLTYARFGNEQPSDIMLLCRPCHDNVHSAPGFFKQTKKNKVEEIPAYEFANIIDPIIL